MPKLWEKWLDQEDAVLLDFIKDGVHFRTIENSEFLSRHSPKAIMQRVYNIFKENPELGHLVRLGRQYRAIHRPELRELQRKRRERKRTEVSVYQRRWKAKNQETSKEYSRAYYEKRRGQVSVHNAKRHKYRKDLLKLLEEELIPVHCRTEGVVKKRYSLTIEFSNEESSPDSIKRNVLEASVIAMLGDLSEQLCFDFSATTLSIYPSVVSEDKRFAALNRGKLDSLLKAYSLVFKEQDFEYWQNLQERDAAEAEEHRAIYEAVPLIKPKLGYPIGAVFKYRHSIAVEFLEKDLEMTVTRRHIKAHVSEAIGVAHLWEIYEGLKFNSSGNYIVITPNPKLKEVDRLRLKHLLRAYASFIERPTLS